MKTAKNVPKKDPRETTRAVIYARYSSHAQNEQSIEGQLHDCYEWAQQQNVMVIKEYIDRAMTGTKDDRPDFQRMIEDAAKRQFELVIVWKLDRFSRNRYDSAIYKTRLKKYGVRVVSVKENISDAPEGIILEGMLESMAEYYSANLSQNVKRGIRESMEKGYFCGVCGCEADAPFEWDFCPACGTRFDWRTWVDPREGDEDLAFDLRGDR